MTSLAGAEGGGRAKKAGLAERSSTALQPLDAPTQASSVDFSFIS